MQKLPLLCTPMIPFPFRLTTGLAALAACICFTSCKTTQSGSGYDDVVDYTSPNTKLPKEEYPFDDSGNYREDWAARGAGVSGVKDKPADTALYTQASDSTPPAQPSYGGPVNHPAYVSEDPAPGISTVSTTPRSSSPSSSVRRTTSSPSRSTASRSSSSSRSKPKPKPKPVAKPTVVKVKPGDTLYGLSKRYGVSVASIKSANGLKGDTIVDGKPLRIPKKK
jgi:hypothetical protein